MRGDGWRLREPRGRHRGDTKGDVTNEHGEFGRTSCLNELGHHHRVNAVMPYTGLVDFAVCD